MCYCFKVKCPPIAFAHKCFFCKVMELLFPYTYKWIIPLISLHLNVFLRSSDWLKVGDPWTVT